jgi:ribonuclease T2
MMVFLSSSKSPLFLFYLFLTASTIAFADSVHVCTPSDASCWPTDSEVQALRELLEPNLNRTYFYVGGPPIGAVPFLDTREDGGIQPLYGLGETGLDPLYVRDVADIRSGRCFTETFDEFCLSSSRNNPVPGMEPAFVAFPVTVEHVQALLAFVREHDLAVCVAGTDHDFLNRHSCDGVLIRMNLFKSIEFLDPVVDNGTGSVRVGAGVVFAELHAATANENVAVSSGWASTVGVVGWSIGGGHGPMAPSRGLGVDNILQAQVVLANGTVVIAAEDSPTTADLWWALRGGGGGAWGIITSLTLRTHPVPDEGYTVALFVYAGTFCPEELDVLSNYLNAHKDVVLASDGRFSGLFYVQSSRDDAPVSGCGGGWVTTAQYAFQGNLTADEQAFELTTSLRIEGREALLENLENFGSWNEYVQGSDIGHIIPVQWIPRGIHSALVSRETTASGGVHDLVLSLVEKCRDGGTCSRSEFYSAITGNTDSEQGENVSIHPEFRTAVLHFVNGGVDDEDVPRILGLSNSSYFNEASFSFEEYDYDYRQRFWGSNYELLVAINAKYDPEHLFQCHNCVAPDSSEPPTVAPTLAPTAAPSTSVATSGGGFMALVVSIVVLSAHLLG